MGKHLLGVLLRGTEHDILFGRVIVIGGPLEVYFKGLRRSETPPKV